MVVAGQAVRMLVVQLNTGDLLLRLQSKHYIRLLNGIKSSAFIGLFFRVIFTGRIRLWWIIGWNWNLSR